jgi:hypothetical protein
MVLSDRDDVRVAETGEELLILDVSDDELERAAPIIGGGSLRRNPEFCYCHSR